MKKLKDGKLSIVTAVLLFVMAVGVASVCFMPERTVLISGKSAVEPVYTGNRNANYVSLMINVYEGGEKS